MKRIFVMIVCFIFLCSCNAGNGELLPAKSDTDLKADIISESGYRTISASEAKEIMSSGEGFILLDVRTEKEYREKRIEGAVLIPDYEIAEHAESELPDKTAVILIYCRSGRRSANAAEGLAGMGYTNIYDFGGILDWTYATISG